LRKARDVVAVDSGAARNSEEIEGSSINQRLETRAGAVNAGGERERLGIEVVSYLAAGKTNS
jgi:hypothetical protein